MTLDISKVAIQVGEMVEELKSDQAEHLQHLKYAQDKLNDPNLDVEKLKSKIVAAKTTWLVPGLVDGLNKAFTAGPVPAEFIVIAADGSHIDVDRNRAVRCYLINIGTVLLKYGAFPDAVLESAPHLHCGRDQMEIVDEKNPTQKRPLDATLLGIIRGIEETRFLASLAVTLPPDSNVLALVDGTLIRWGLEAYPDFVIEQLVKGQFLSCLDRVKELNKDRRIALASYISLPRSTEVVNALRVAICPEETPDCDRCHQAEGTRPCEVVEGVQDQMLFSKLLKPGERSSLFFSRSSLVEKHYQGNRIYFFYLRVENEIARVELPEWAITDKHLLELTHTLVLDQCRRGHGYPVALSEAHEKAVVSGADRQEFWAFIEESMQEEKMPTETSTKSLSKKTRWV
jgi:hypothetical protein